jgi:NitT/TauT family transport system permease protein
MSQPNNVSAKPTNRAATDSLLTVFLLLAALLAWEGAVRLLHVPAWLVPPPTTVAAALVRDSFPLIARHTWVTVQEIAAGLALGGSLGLALGVLLAYAPRAERVLAPFVLAVQTTPKIALAPLFVVWFGFGITSKVVIVALIAFFPIMVNAVAGFTALDAGLAELMRSLSASRRQAFLLARLPAALPALFAGVKIAIVQSVVGAVAAEFVGGKEGLGYLIMYSGSLLQTDRLFAVLVVLLLLGLVLYWMVVALERRVITWE